MVAGTQNQCFKLVKLKSPAKSPAKFYTNANMKANSRRNGASHITVTGLVKCFENQVSL